MWLSSILTLLLYVIAIEAVTEIIAEGRIFDSARLYISKKSDFLFNLITCPYCLSVWVACVLYFMPMPILIVFTAHRLSNIFHACINRYVRLND